MIRIALVIDGTKDGRDNSKMILGKLGVKVFDSDGSGGDVLNIVKEYVLGLDQSKIVDVIFIYQTTNGVDGPQTTKRIRNLGFKGIIIGLTEKAKDPSAQAFRACGASKLLSKPLCLEKVVGILKGTIIPK